MLTIQSIIGLLSISQLTFMGLAYLGHFRQSTLARYVSLYCVCLGSYVVLSMPEFSLIPSPLSDLIRAAAVAAPGLLWMISRKLFIDKENTPTLIWFTMALYIVCFVIAARLVINGSPDTSLSSALSMVRLKSGTSPILLGIYLPYLVMLSFAAHALIMAAQQYQADLVETRRQLRLPFILSMAVIVFLIVGTGMFGIVTPVMRTLFYLYLFLCTLFFNLTSFKVSDTASDLLLSGDLSETELPQLSVKDQEFLERLTNTLETNHLYADSALTIGSLALKAKTREYRLRQFINKKLKYRNFNQYLNNFRIEKATDRLAQTDNRQASIADIAADSGFASLSVFNRAFKEKHGVTPSVFRQRNS